MDNLASTPTATTTSSGDYKIDALLSGYKWNGKTITYSFFKGGSYYGTETGVSQVSEPIKQNIRLILERYIEPFIDVDFVEVADTGSSYGQMRYMFSNGPSNAYANYPFGSQFGDTDIGGDVYLNPAYDQFFQGGPGIGGFNTLLHETLHALGLKHPGNYGSAPPFLPYGEDNNTNTVMSYNNSNDSVATPMPYDIKALQYLYGARSFNAGNTTYSFDSVYKYTDGSRTWGSATTPLKLTIWDSGGIDTLDFSHLAYDASGYRFDLNHGGILTSQSAYNKSAFGVFNQASDKLYYTSSYGTAIAYGVTLEKAIGSSSNDRIIGNALANIVRGGNGNDHLSGGNGNDSLYGEAHNDYLEGEAGNDTLDGGAGNDTLIGGVGDDTYFVDSTGDVISEATSAGIDTVNSSISYNLGANLERLTLTGNSALNGTGNTLNNTITGNAANNTLNGGIGHDTLIGGLGNDTYFVDSTRDVISEAASAGIDTVNSSINYSLEANLENLILTGSSAINGTGNTLNNTITGNAANNTLNGGTGNDTLNGGTGNDTLIGGLGNDTYFVDSTGDVINEAPSAGLDMVNASISYTLGANLEQLSLTDSRAINGTGNALNNLIRGNGANNTLRGGAGNDTLNGWAGNDTLVGESGNDLLIGGAGNDRLRGGAGADRFCFFNLSEGIDIITDFNVVDDTISLSRAGFGGTLTAGAAISGAQFRLGSAAGDNSDRFIYNRNTGALFFDADGTGSSAQTQIAQLQAGLGLTHQDIVVFA
jgi:Ca2+-binding RTX toxin-like protein